MLNALACQWSVHARNSPKHPPQFSANHRILEEPLMMVSTWSTEITTNPIQTRNKTMRKKTCNYFFLLLLFMKQQHIRRTKTNGKIKREKSDGTKATSERLKPNRNNKNQMGREEEKNTKTKWFYVCKMFNFSQHLDMFIRIGHRRRALRYGIDENILWFISS